MWTVDHSKREQWMPAWPERVNMKARGPMYVAIWDAGRFMVFPTLPSLLDHFMMPRSALVD